MTDDPAIHGVYLSGTLDLEALYGDALRAAAGDVILHRPDEVGDPTDMRFAICWAPDLDAFAPYPNLSLAMSIGAGVDALLAHPGIEEGVSIARIRDPHQAALMAGFAVHEVLHAEREFEALMQSAADGRWLPLPLRAPDSTVIAVLGNGTMGRAVVAALHGLGFSLRVACRSAPDHPQSGVTYLTGAGAPKDAAAGADYVINVLPLTAETEDVLSSALFAQLRPGARLIQIGRGEHLVEADLEAALNSGQLVGATLDVFRTEPLPPDHPYWSDPRLRITPHIASDSTPQTVAAQVVQTARALRDGGHLKLSVDRAQGY